jgi:hypothetical protein
MKKIFQLLLALSALCFSISSVYADTPTSLRGEHGAHMMISGKITLFRAQIRDLDFGPPNDHIKAEVLISIDSKPDMVFGVAHETNDPGATAMIETLREAYLHDLPVTVLAPELPGRKNLRLVWVELGK